MKKAYLVTIIFFAAFSNVLTVQAQKKPNIIFILTDDQGYGDIGVFFQQQRQKSGNRSLPYELTPNLDKLAARGARFTQQYCNAPVCAPSRASLLTGVNQGNASVRDNQFDKEIENNHTIATVLKTAGYTTAAIGKWGLQGVKEDGPDWPAHPLKRGFDSFYGYMRHADGHEHYPAEGLYRGKKQVWDNYKNVAAGLDKCYTTDLWTSAAKKWITDYEKGEDANKPFLMYLAYDCPHAVIELPAKPYPAGGGLKGGLQWLGQPGHMINTAEGTIDSYMYPEYANATYDDDNDPKTPEKAWPETYKRYATATRRIDDAVDDIMQLLTDLKIDDNTLVVFTSDNGPSIESYLPASYVPNHPTFFGSYGPFDGIKRDCWEGGLRVPTIAAWNGHINAGKIINTPSMLSDWMATFADAAQIPVPARTDGVSLLPALTGKGKQQPGLVYSEYYESGKTPDFKEFEASRRGRKRDQMQMIRMGDLVGVRYAITSANDDFEIYNVVKDPKEVINLALKSGFEAIQAQMKTKVLQLRHADKEAPRPYDNVAIPASPAVGNIQPGLSWKFYQGNFPWVVSEQNLHADGKGVCSKLTVLKTENKAGLVCYEGFIKIPADGTYTFALQATGKAYLRLHEATLIDEDFGYLSGTELSQTLNLKAGLHPVKLYYLVSANTLPEIQLRLKPENSAWADVSDLGFYRAK
ncbi:sulfatase-like hydrolase/transferase [Mucilaginibacter sp. SP1R1]|uniref:sulfatase-like hydrolase/transferase n=1 Tax=Mucilaginibacter sp. SP1R1 TaxID=2723091 RepID=UPI001609D056|nr:sulfatase-like hydrolase/transferase [Mucilaginibacter sp. SP1R1]MBB6148448.1 arylsulfatase A-like enzyme [Mucilaginibacter sp. SP1R1]